MKIQKTSKNLDETLRLSIEIAKTQKSMVLDENILFASLLSMRDSAAVRALQDLEIDIESTINNIFTKISGPDLNLSLPKDAKIKIDLTVSQVYKKIIEDAYKIAMQMPAPYVGTEHLLAAWYEDVNNDIKDNLVKKGIDHQSLYLAIKNTVKYPILLDDKNFTEKNSVLKMLGRNLTELASKKKLDPVVGREIEMQRLAGILLRRTKNNPILIGDAGVGKTAIIEGFAQKVADKKMPYLFRDKQIWQIDSAILFAGSAMRGDLENKLLALIDEVTNDPSIILFVDEIHTLISGGSSSGGADVSNILKPALAKGQLRCIGATTYAEYVKYIESDPALARRFQPIYIDEINADSAKVIINKIKPTLEKYHHVSISDEIVSDAIQLSERYITDRYLPDKAIDLLDEASAKINLNYVSVLDENITVLETLEKEQQKMIQHDDISGAARIRDTKREIQKIVKEITAPRKAHSAMKIADLKEVVSQWTGIPISSLSTADIKKIKDLSILLSQNIVGQKKAIEIVSDALQIAKVGLSDEKKPMSSFLFAGPTGVGKTELAKQIAKNLFGSKDSLVQFDMSEFMEAHSVSKLIGSPPGYIGFDTGGQLTERIRKRPYCVVLFDEIEKAHPDILNILLQILEEGKLTDSKGRLANFKNTLIIMTTNLGANSIIDNKVLGFRLNKTNNDNSEQDENQAYSDMEKMVMEELKNHMQPELMNRIDHIVVFKTLNKDNAQEIATIHLSELADRILKYKKIKVSFEQSVAKYIARNGFDFQYGARNIKRKINELVETRISKYLLDSKKNIKTLKVTFSKSEIRIS